jgi:hypothetical protein
VLLTIRQSLKAGKHNALSRNTASGRTGSSMGHRVLYLHSPFEHEELCVCLLLQYLLQSCLRGGKGIVEEMCYERRRAKACVA